MAMKIMLGEANGEPRWMLDGTPLGRERIMMIRDGHEVLGMFSADGDDAPGSPVFEWLMAGTTDTQRVDIRVDSDTFRRPTKEEGGPFPHEIRRLH